MSVTTWPKITIRTIAIGNILMGAMGLYLQIDSAIRFSLRHQFTTARPYEAHAYWVASSISFVFASLALLSGFSLWRNGRSALRLCNWFFGSELAYWVGSAMLVVMLVTSKSDWAHRLGMTIGSVGGIGDMGTAPQVLSLYPVWVLVLLNVAYWRIGKPKPSTAKTSV
jgi:hypothetical protein